MSEEPKKLTPQAQDLVDGMWRSSTGNARERRRREREHMETRMVLKTIVVMVVVEILLGVVGLVAGIVAFFRDGVAFHIAIGCAVASFAITYAVKAWRTGPLRRFDAPVRVAGMTLAGVGALLALGTVNPLFYLLALLLIPAWYSAH